jgi:hypothetical protein
MITPKTGINQIHLNFLQAPKSVPNQNRDTNPPALNDTYEGQPDPVSHRSSIGRIESLNAVFNAEAVSIRAVDSDMGAIEKRIDHMRQGLSKILDNPQSYGPGSQERTQLLNQVGQHGQEARPFAESLGALATRNVEFDASVGQKRGLLELRVEADRMQYIVESRFDRIGMHALQLPDVSSSATDKELLSSLEHLDGIRNRIRTGRETLFEDVSQLIQSRSAYAGNEAQFYEKINDEEVETVGLGVRRDLSLLPGGGITVDSTPLAALLN